MSLTRCTCIGYLEPHVLTSRPSWRTIVADPDCSYGRHRALDVAEGSPGHVPS